MHTTQIERSNRRHFCGRATVLQKHRVTGPTCVLSSFFPFLVILNRHSLHVISASSTFILRPDSSDATSRSSLFLLGFACALSAGGRPSGRMQRAAL